jgi:hypothetical protein
MRQLSRDDHLHPEFWVEPQKGLECATTESWPAEVRVPKLFKTYLGIGAKICGPPAIDRLFKTIDFFVIFDLFHTNERMRRMFL